MSKTFPIWVVPVWAVLMGVKTVLNGARRVGRGFKRKPKHRICASCGYMAGAGQLCTKCGEPSPAEEL